MSSYEQNSTLEHLISVREWTPADLRIKVYKINYLTPVLDLIEKYGKRWTLTSNFERLRVRAIQGEKVESEKSECNNSGYKLTGLTWWRDGLGRC